MSFCVCVGLQADALIGCFRFVEGYYLLFVTQKNYIGSICGERKAQPLEL